MSWNISNFVFMKTIELNKLKETTQPIRHKIFIKYRSRFGEDLGGCCAIASGILFEHLRKDFKGIKIVMSEEHGGGGCSHCFLVYKNYIIDVTATQFGHIETILIFKDDKKKFDDSEWDYWYWYGRRKYFHDVKSLKKYQKRYNWPAEQLYWSNHYKNK